MEFLRSLFSSPSAPDLKTLRPDAQKAKLRLEFQGRCQEAAVGLIAAPQSPKTELHFQVTARSEGQDGGKNWD